MLREIGSMLKSGFLELASLWPFYLFALPFFLWLIGMLFALLGVF